MTAVKKFFCIVLVLAVLTGMTSCASKGFDYKKMVRFSGKQDFEAFDDLCKTYGVIPPSEY